MIPYKQLSLADIFLDCHEKFENDKPAFLSLLETHIDINKLIPISFRNHFYASTGRTRKYPLQLFYKNISFHPKRKLMIHDEKQLTNTFPIYHLIWRCQWHKKMFIYNMKHICLLPSKPLYCLIYRIFQYPVFLPPTRSIKFFSFNESKAR